MKTVKIITNWGSEKWVEIITRFFNRGNEKIKFVSEGVADYYFIVNGLGGNDTFHERHKTIVAFMEPTPICQQRFRLFFEKHSDYFYYFTRERDLNPVELHLGPLTFHDVSKSFNKTKTLSMIVSNLYMLEGHRKRIELIKYIQTKNPELVDVYGRCQSLGLQNYKGELPNIDKRNGILPYKYHIACENYSENNYITEKLSDPIVGECLTFYWGAKNVEDYYNGAYIWLNLDNLEECYQTIVYAINNNEWERRLPYILEAKRRLLNEYQLYPTLERLINNVSENK